MGYKHELVLRGLLFFLLIRIFIRIRGTRAPSLWSKPISQRRWESTSSVVYAGQRMHGAHEALAYDLTRSARRYLEYVPSFLWRITKSGILHKNERALTPNTACLIALTRSLRHHVVNTQLCPASTKPQTSRLTP